MKKTILVLIAVIMLVPTAGIFAGGARDEAPADAVRVNLFHYKDIVHDGYNELAKAFMAQNPDVNMTVEMLTTEYNTVLRSRDAAGQLPQIWAASTPGEGALMPFVNEGKIAPVNDFAVVGSLSDSIRESVTFSDGNVYLVPLLTTARGIIYNKEIFSKAGYDSFPATLDELKQACEKISAMGVHPFATAGAEGWAVGSNIYQIGHEVFASADFAQRMNAGEASHMEIMEIFGFIDLVRDNSQPGFMSTDFMSSVVLYAQEQAAMIIQGPWAADAMMDLAPGVVAKSAMTGLPFTNNPSDSYLYIDFDAYFAVSGSPEQVAAADRFFDFVVNGDGRAIFSEEVRSLNAFGIPFEAHAVNESILKQSEAGTVIGAMQYANAPDGWWQNQGTAMQEYLMGAVTKEQMLRNLDSEWKSMLD